MNGENGDKDDNDELARAQTGKSEIAMIICGVDEMR